MKRGAAVLLCLFLGCGDDDQPQVIVPASVDGAVAADMARAPAAVDMAMVAVQPDMAMAPAAVDMAMAPAADMATPPAPQMMQVMVGPGNSFSFSPALVTIAAGGTVQWVWQSASVPHTVTSGAPGAADGNFCNVNGMANVANCSNANYAQIAPFTYSHTFPTAGTFPYFCEIHGALMTGTVTVTP